jgi:hypothetical protein
MTVDRTATIWSEHERRLVPRSLELGVSHLADLDPELELSSIVSGPDPNT